MAVPLSDDADVPNYNFLVRWMFLPMFSFISQMRKRTFLPKTSERRVATRHGFEP